MKIGSLLAGLDYNLFQGDLNTDITSIYNDSRKVTEGSLFFCISGSVVDGHDFINDVVSKGAAAIVIEQKDVKLDIPENVCVIYVESSRYAMGMISSAFYGYPSKSLKVIGITGTKGKTTTTYMIKSMLEEAGYKTGLIGTMEIIVGDKVTPAVNTTPESMTIQKTLREMVDEGLDSVVMEVSSQGLMLDRVAGIEFDYGIFTNLSEDHIGPNEHKSFDEYRMWKSKLFSMCETGIFNADDENYEAILGGHGCKVVTYGMSEGLDYVASNVHLYNKEGSLGIEYDLEGVEKADIIVDTPGKFSVYNSLAAISVARQLDIPMSIVCDILTKIKVKGRVELIPISDEFTIIIDYAHNAVSMESILTTLKDYNPDRLVSLFGCGGNRSKVRRYEMGEVSGHLADLTIITSDNPRDEEPQAIIDDIKTGFAKTNGEYVEIIDRKEAIRYAILNAKPGDVIVLAGKGHEDYQEIKGHKYHMDERDLIREILEEEDVDKICGYNNRYFA